MIVLFNWCKNCDIWFQLLTRFARQDYNTVSITWYLCFISINSLGRRQFVTIIVVKNG